MGRLLGRQDAAEVQDRNRTGQGYAIPDGHIDRYQINLSPVGTGSSTAGANLQDAWPPGRPFSLKNGPGCHFALAIRPENSPIRCDFPFLRFRRTMAHDK